jgi:methyl-accepting chemotaxis protein
MGNPLRLAIEVALDSENAKEAIEGFKGVVESAVDALKGNFTSLTSAVEGSAGALGILTGVVGAAGAGLFELASHAAEVGTQIYEAGERTGFTAEKLSGLMALSKETGGNFEGLTLALSRAGVNLEKTSEGAGKLNPLLYQIMGGAQGAAELGLKPMDDRIQEVLKSIFELHDVGQQHAALQELMGRNWMHNVEALKLLAEQGYGPAIEQAKKFGVFFDAEAARRAREFTMEWNTLKAEFSSFALILGEKVMPAVESFMVSMAGFVPLVKEWYYYVVGFFKMLGGEEGSEFRKAAEAQRESTQAMTDMLVRIQSATKEAAAGHEIHTGKVKEGTDALDKHREKMLDVIAGYHAHVPLIKDAAFYLAEFIKQLTATDDRLKAVHFDMQEAVKDFQGLTAITPIAGSQLAVLDLGMERWTWGTKRGADSLKELLEQLNLWNVQVPHTVDILKTVEDEFGTSEQMIGRFSEALGRGVTAAVFSGESIGKALDKALKSTLESIASEALVRALFDTGMGFAALASGDVAAATQWFEAAAIMGGVAAVAGAAGAALPGGGGAGVGAAAPRAVTTASGGYAGGPAAGGGPGGSYAAAGPTTHFNFYGGVISADTLTQFTTQLNNAVRGGQVTLVSSNALTTGPKLT